MIDANQDNEALKQIVKEALTEVLREERELFQEILSEVLEDYGLVEAIRQGLQTPMATRDEVFDVLQQNTE